MRLRGVSKRYGARERWILRDLHLDVPPGLVRIEGANGSGKSTLLRVLAGVSAPTRGRVLDRPATGYVPERFPPALPFTARTYLTHLGRIRGLSSRQARAAADSCLERFGMTEYANTSLRALSKGTCQKVAVAQAVASPQDLLVFDEAWTGLDQPSRAALDEVVIQRLAAGSSVVFVDHDPTRLAHLDPTRWTVAHGQVSATSTGRGSTRAPTTLIELTGYPAEAPDPALSPGVTSARRVGELLRLVVSADASDAVLRALLDTGDTVHITAVRDNPDAPSGEPNESAR